MNYYQKGDTTPSHLEYALTKLTSAYSNQLDLIQKPLNEQVLMWLLEEQRIRVERGIMEDVLLWLARGAPPHD